MKKVFIFILFLISLNSCTIMDYSDVWDFEITDSMKEHIHSISDIEDWVVKNIKYKSDESRYGHDVYQTCQETLDRGIGDCDDISILILGITWKMFKIKGYLKVYENYNKWEGHAWPYIKGKDYYNNEHNFKESYSIHFDEIHLNMSR